MMPEYFSQFYELILSEEDDWFDPRMNLDTDLYIDPFLIFKSNIFFFKGAEEKFFDFFNSAFNIASDPKKSNVLQDVLTFPEPYEICLGDSEKGIFGLGPGKQFAKACAKTLADLASRGRTDLKHFEEIEIFTSGIAQDGISDVTAIILRREFIKYTQEICRRHRIDMKSFAVRNANFNFSQFPDVWEHSKYELPRNPFPRERKSGKHSDQGVILIPKEFLCTSHAISTDGFSEYIKGKNPEVLRHALNYKVDESLDKEEVKKKSKQNKSKIREIAINSPDLVREYIENVENNADKIMPYDLETDQKNIYQPQKKSGEFVSSNPLVISANSQDEFIKAVEIMIKQFKLYVEDRSGYKLLWNDSDQNKLKDDNPKPRKEEVGQLLFSCTVSSYCKANNIDLTREANLGRGAVDFKFSSGYVARALVELKLAQSPKLEQGAVKQLPQYLKTEEIYHGYYIVIIYTEKDRLKFEKASQLFDSFDFGDRIFTVIGIDVTRNKPSASNL